MKRKGRSDALFHETIYTWLYEDEWAKMMSNSISICVLEGKKERNKLADQFIDQKYQTELVLLKDQIWLEKRLNMVTGKEIVLSIQINMQLTRSMNSALEK